MVRQPGAHLSDFILSAWKYASPGHVSLAYFLSFSYHHTLSNELSPECLDDAQRFIMNNNMKLGYYCMSNLLISVSTLLVVSPYLSFVPSFAEIDEIFAISPVTKQLTKIKFRHSHLETN